MGKDIKKISVITPSYNHGRYLDKCINSIKGEAEILTNVTIEHIIVDNCSTDETIEVLHRYQRDPGKVALKVMVYVAIISAGC